MDVRYLLLLISSLTLAACGNVGRFSQSFHESSPQCAEAAVPTRYVVHEKFGGIKIEIVSREELEQKYSDPDLLENIEAIEPDYKISVQEEKEAASSGDGNWGIDAVNVGGPWSAGFYGQNVMVAVIDSGMDIYHPQLRGRVVANSAEMTGRPGVDDDNNGYVDDITSWNFGANSADVADELGHGTHVAGIIAAEHTGNIADPRGVAPGANLLPISFIDGSGSGYISNAIRALDYARARGAKIINASWGGGSCSTILQQKIEALKAAGIIFVAAAGNAGNNIDLILEYPASLNLENQITVGSVGALNELSDFSNFGSATVHLLAPGANILSTFPGGYRHMTGTSMATPFVAGAAALLKGAFPQASYSQIKTAILNSVVAGNYPVQTRGRLNIGAAFSYLQNR